MKIVLLIFAAIQVTTLQGLPMACRDRIISRFMVMMPSPYMQDKWVFFPWPVHKTIIMNGLKGSAEDMVVENEYEKEDFWSKMDGKWMKEIRDFIVRKYKLSSSNMFKENFGLVGQKNPGKSEYLSERDREWVQEIKEYFKNKYLSSPFKSSNKGSKISIKEKNDYWSKMDGKWAQEIRDHIKEKYSSEADGKFTEKEKDGKISITKPATEEKDIHAVMQELPLEVNESSSFENSEIARDFESDSSKKFEKDKIEKKPNMNGEFVTSEELELLSAEMPELEKLVPKNKESKENSLSEEDMPAEIKEKLDKADMFQIKEEFNSESSSVEEEVYNSKSPFLPSTKEDGTIIFDISKFVKENKGIYKPEKSETKIKEKLFIFPQKYIIKGKNSSINDKTQNSEESGEIPKEKNGKLSFTSDDELEKKLGDTPVVGCKKKNSMKSATLVSTNSAKEQLHSYLSEGSGEKKTSAESSEVNVDSVQEKLHDMPVTGCKKKDVQKNPTLVVSNYPPQNTAQTISDKTSSEESGEFHQNFQKFGKFKKSKKYKIPYGLANKFQNDLSIGQPGKPMKRFASV